jgi:hypothetical protein
MKRLVLVVLVALACSCTKKKKAPAVNWPDQYSLVTVQSGHTYKVLQIWPITEKGKHAGLGISYISYARDFPALTAAADELFEFARAQAEATDDKLVAVLAKLGFDPTQKVSQSTDWNLVYTRGADGVWTRLHENDDAAFPKLAPQTDVDERDLAAQKEVAANVKDFLEQLDNGKIEKTYDELDPAVKKTVTRDEWTKKIADQRASYGPLEGRQQFAVVQTTAVTGGPKGKFIINRFHSKFRSKAHAEEVVSEMLGQDGNWHLVGYALTSP